MRLEKYFPHQPTSYRERHKAHRDVVLQQRMLCANKLLEIFFYCPSTDWHEDGIGSCHGEGRSYDDDAGGIIFDFADLRHTLRDERIPEVSTEHAAKACSFHHPCRGCVVGVLRPDKCLRYTSFNIDLPKSFRTLGDLEELFSRIAFGRADEPPANGEGPWGRPELNWPMVTEFLAKAELVLRDARENYKRRNNGVLHLPILHTPRTPLVTIDNVG